MTQIDFALLRKIQSKQFNVKQIIAPWQLFLKLKIGILFLLRYQKGHCIENTDYFFQLVSRTVFTCKKEAQNKNKQFSLDRKSLSADGNKAFPPKKWISTNSSDCFHWWKKRINKRKRFQQDRKCVSTIRGGRFV